MADRRPLGDQSQRATLTEEQIGGVFRQLCDEHIAERRRDDPEAAWQLIEQGLQSPGLRVLPEKDPRWPRVLALAAAAAILLASGLGYVLAQHDQLEYSIEGRGSGSLLADSTGEAHGDLVATEEEPVSLLFTDESRMELRPFTTLRLQVGAQSRVVARLAQGSVDVHVEHRPGTDYRFIAGPYEVRVIGTAFQLSYEPDDETFALDLREGRVSVRDPKGREYQLSGGESLHLPEMPAKEPADQGSAPVPEPTVVESEEKAANQEPRAAPSPTYRSLAARGRFADIVALARREGLQQVLTTKSSSELQELAQAARYTGDLRLAVQTWQRLRDRFPSESLGINAAFFLGRTAEQTGDPAKALVWYESYLGASPGGVYAAEAMGRKLVMLQEQKGKAAARPLARTYLQRFPDGSYAATARDILKNASPRR